MGNIAGALAVDKYCHARFLRHLFHVGSLFLGTPAGVIISRTGIDIDTSVILIDTLGHAIAIPDSGCMFLPVQSLSFLFTAVLIVVVVTQLLRILTLRAKDITVLAVICLDLLVDKFLNRHLFSHAHRPHLFIKGFLHANPLFIYTLIQIGVPIAIQLKPGTRVELSELKMRQVNSVLLAEETAMLNRPKFGAEDPLVKDTSTTGVVPSAYAIGKVTVLSSTEELPTFCDSLVPH